MFSGKRWKGRCLRILAVCALLGCIGLGGWLVAIYCLAEYHVRQGKQALAQQRLFKAWDHLQKARTFRPRSTEIYLLLARLARQRRSYPEAREYLQRYQDLGGPDTEEVQLEQLMLRAQMGEAEKIIDKLWAYVVEKKPQASLVLEALTVGFLGRNLTLEVRSALDKWRKIDLDNVQRLFYEGWVEEVRLNSIGARDNYRRALAIDPDRTDIRLRLGGVLLGRQADKEAIAEFEQVLQTLPGNVEARLGLARGQRSLGLRQEARQNLEAALRDDPDNALALKELGWVALDDGKVAEAETLFRKVLDQMPSDHDTLYNLIICLRRLGRTAEADKLKPRLEQTEKDSRRLYEVLLRELALRPNDVEMAYEAARLCFRLGQEQDGLIWYDRILGVDPYHRATHRRLAEYFEKHGDKKNAEAHRAMLRRR